RQSRLNLRVAHPLRLSQRVGPLSSFVGRAPHRFALSCEGRLQKGAASDLASSTTTPTRQPTLRALRAPTSANSALSLCLTPPSEKSSRSPPKDATNSSPPLPTAFVPLASTGKIAPVGCSPTRPTRLQSIRAAR